MNKCIVCGEDSGFAMICDRCRETILYYRAKYNAKKKLNETTELDNLVFEEFVKQLELDEVLEDNITGLFPQNCDKTITEIVSYIRQMLGNNEWLNKQENRMEAFIEYIKNYIRKYYNEHKEIQ